MRLTTTLNRIRACNPCTAGWRKLIKHLGEDFDPDAEIDLLTILESNDVADMLWTLRATIQDSKRISSQLAIEFAEQALPIFEKRRPDDPRPRRAIQAARDYLDGKISLEDLRAARATYAAAYAATYATTYAANAADADAADAANAAADAANAAAAATYAATYAANAADADAADAAKVKVREKQADIIRSILE